MNTNKNKKETKKISFIDDKKYLLTARKNGEALKIASATSRIEAPKLRNGTTFSLLAPLSLVSKTKTRYSGEEYIAGVEKLLKPEDGKARSKAFYVFEEEYRRLNLGKTGELSKKLSPVVSKFKKRVSEGYIRYFDISDSPKDFRDYFGFRS